MANTKDFSDLNYQPLPHNFPDHELKLSTLLPIVLSPDPAPAFVQKPTMLPAYIVFLTSKICKRIRKIPH
eukprot:UN03946